MFQQKDTHEPSQRALTHPQRTALTNYVMPSAPDGTGIMASPLNRSQAWLFVNREIAGPTATISRLTLDVASM